MNKTAEVIYVAKKMSSQDTRDFQKTYSTESRKDTTLLDSRVKSSENRVRVSSRGQVDVKSLPDKPQPQKQHSNVYQQVISESPHKKSVRDTSQKGSRNSSLAQRYNESLQKMTTRSNGQDLLSSRN